MVDFRGVHAEPAWRLDGHEHVLRTRRRELRRALRRVAALLNDVLTEVVVKLSNQSPYWVGETVSTLSSRTSSGATQRSSSVSCAVRRSTSDCPLSGVVTEVYPRASSSSSRFTVLSGVSSPKAVPMPSSLGG